MGKNSSEKGRQNVFYIHTNIVTKKSGGKITNSTIKNAGRKCTEISGKKRFYTLTNIVTNQSMEKNA